MSTYVDIRAKYVAQAYLPLVHNFYPYAEQQSHIGQEAKLYRSIYVTYIGRYPPPPQLRVAKQYTPECQALTKRLYSPIPLPYSSAERRTLSP